MNLQEVIKAGRSGFHLHRDQYYLCDAAGNAAGQMMAFVARPAFLISTGTAICGGSAIAAVGPITGATEDEMSVSLGTVFVLNSVALLTFPAMGCGCNLSQTQFGLVGSARHSRHQFCGRCCGQVWRGRTGGGNHSETGARTLDRAHVDRHGGCERQQDAASSGHGSSCSSAWRPWRTHTFFLGLTCITG